jgi:hypothetical protein
MKMLRNLLLHIFSVTDPAQAQKVFFYIQVGFAVAVLLMIYFMSRRKDESGFRVREADKKKPVTPSKLGQIKHDDSLANAKMKRNEPLKLSGIRIDGEPHEILGVPRDASEKQIQAAYRDLMKRYHPDVIGRPGSREWEDAQKIAEALNGARKQMLAAQSQSPNRSGR